MEIRIDNDRSDESCRISLSGTVSGPQGNTKAEPDHLVKVSNGRPVLMSLADAEFVDSSGVGWLLQIDKRLQASGTRLHVHSIPPNIQQVFSMLKLNKVLTLCTDEADALSRSQQEASDGDN